MMVVATETNKTHVKVNPSACTVEVPNADTIAAINELRDGQGQAFSGTVDDFFSLLNSLPDEDEQ